MATRDDVRAALVHDLRAVGNDLKALLEDPKERKKKERRWRILYGAVALASTLAMRRIATRAWGILTGETAPVRGQQASK